MFTLDSRTTSMICWHPTLGLKKGEHYTVDMVEYDKFILYIDPVVEMFTVGGIRYATLDGKQLSSIFGKRQVKDFLHEQLAKEL